MTVIVLLFVYFAGLAFGVARKVSRAEVARAHLVFAVPGVVALAAGFA